MKKPISCAGCKTYDSKTPCFRLSKLHYECPCRKCLVKTMCTSQCYPFELLFIKEIEYYREGVKN